VLEAFQADEVDEIGHLLGELGLAGARELQAVGDVVEHRLPREQAEVLEDHRDAGPRLGHALALERDLAAVGGDEAVDAAQQRGLAAARGTDQGHDLALAHLEIDAAEHLERAVALGEAGDADARTRLRRGTERPDAEVARGRANAHSAAERAGAGRRFAQ
jgi:hypothetical protein